MITPSRKRHVDARRTGNSDDYLKKVPAKLPVPIAVELHNLLPRIQRVPTKKWFRPEYTSRLLHVVRLEISAVNECSASRNTGPTNASEASTTTGTRRRNRPLHSSIHTRLTQCPVWQHLDDSIDYQDLTVAEYESLTARFFVNEEALAETNDETTHCFLETPLHPSKLCRIARMPHNLPLNCTVVRFSDSSLRVHPADYQLLLKDSEQDDTIRPIPIVTTKTPTSSPLGHGNSYNSRSSLNISMSQDDAIFDDQVFTALDSPTLVNTPIRDVVSEAMHIFKDLSVTNLLDREDFNLELNGCATAGDGTNEDGLNRPVGDHVPTFDDTENCSDKVTPDGCLIQNELSDAIAKLSGQQLALDSDALELMLQMESEALERERATLQQERRHLLVLTDVIRETGAHIEKIESAVRAEQFKVDESMFLVEAERIRLIRELSNIYPITVDDGRRYFIRGLELPLVLFAGSMVSDDVVSAALGFLCHTVRLMSKYLGVHLRHRLHYQSSQSVIQNEYDVTFPLFLCRPIERGQFEHAVRLLNASIDCICQAQRIQVSNKLHILAKTMRIFEKIIEGY